MTNHTTMLNRDAKATIQLMLADIGDEKKQELIEKYSGSDKVISEHRQKVLIGEWLYNASRMLIRGATEDELRKVVEHIQVLIMARKYNLDIERSYKDRDLLSLHRKYFAIYKAIKKENGEVIYEREENKYILKEREALVKERQKNHEILVNRIKELRAEGLEIEKIAGILNKPESTIRNLLNDK